MPSTSTYSAIRNDLIRDEGYRERPYRDSKGHLTIGIGHNLDAGGLCRTAIFAQLEFDIQNKAVGPLDAQLGWWRGCPEDVQRVLVNLCFNLGINSLLKFKHFLSYIQDKNYAKAADALLASEPYHSQVGQRADRLAFLLRSVV